jgi:hypothetical protein
MVEVKYYDCGNSAHCHRTLRGAERCIKPKIKRPKSTEEEKGRMLSRHLNGETFRSIAKDFGISTASAKYRASSFDADWLWFIENPDKLIEHNKYRKAWGLPEIDEIGNEL